MSNTKRVMGKPDPVSGISDALLDLDTKRRTQIANQVQAINRLLVDGSYTVEMERLHGLLASVMAENERLRHVARELAGGQEPEDRLETSREAIRFTLGRKKP